MQLNAQAQIFSGEYTTEFQWNFGEKTNWVNLLRLNLNVPLWNGGEFEAATLHYANVHNTPIIEDYQTFSNIEDDNNVAAIAVCGLWHRFEHLQLFLGVRNMNEDFFTSDCTSLFTNSSEGIFPTISASYPIANYPVSAMTFHFEVELGNWNFHNSLYNGLGYNGWCPDDNPFLIKLKRDGVFNISELSYSWEKGCYFLGAAVHSKLYHMEAEGELCETDEAINSPSAALYIHGEQTIWRSASDGKLSVMAQFSENTSSQVGCRRYAEAGLVYDFGDEQMIGLSARHGWFFSGQETSVEATRYRPINDWFAVQPAVNYIKNNLSGDNVVLLARIYLTF